MPIIGDTTVIIARVTKSTSNALRVQLATPDGTELACARQKGGGGTVLAAVHPHTGSKTDSAGTIGWCPPPATN